MQCAVLNCNNNGESIGNNSKISFHRFPAKNEYKSIWISATGQDAKWKPNKLDCICSEHFKPSLFQIRNNKPFLNGGAIPTLRCIIPASISITTNTIPKTATQPKNITICTPPQSSKVVVIESKSTHEQTETDDEDDEEMDISEESKQPTNDTLDDQLAEIEFKISTQNRQIKHLLQRQRRYNARVPNLRDQIVNLNKSNETVCTCLENLGFPIVSEVLSRIILCDRNEVNDQENPYSEAFEKFIVTLYSLSPAAYNLLRSKFPVGVFPDENFVKNNCSILEADFAESFV